MYKQSRQWLNTNECRSTFKGKFSLETQTIDNRGVPATDGIFHDSESFGSLRRHLEPSESGVVWVAAPVELRSFPPVPSRCFKRLTVFSNSASPP